MTVVYAVEKVKNCLEEMKPLLQEHYEQVAMYKDKIPLEPDYDKYLDLCDSGILHIVTARDEDKLIGYYISMMVPHIHYSSHKFAVNDILYIDEEYRKTLVGLEMFKFAEKCLKEEGVSVMTIHMKTSLPFDSLCEGLGYDYAERNYTKYIGE